MIDSTFLKTEINIIPDVSRETLIELEEYGKYIIERNKRINLISRSTETSVKSRHIYDSAQTIDFINKNDIKECTDLGSGAGLPGIVLGIMMKPKKPEFKLVLYEKSFHKANFLKDMSEKFKINAKIIHGNIFDEKNLITDVIISRAFKPLPIVFEIAFKNFKKFKYIIFYLGKSGKNIIREARKVWTFDCIERKSVTNQDSMIVKISNLERKYA